MKQEKQKPLFAPGEFGTMPERNAEALPSAERIPEYDTTAQNVQLTVVGIALFGLLCVLAQTIALIYAPETN